MWRMEGRNPLKRLRGNTQAKEWLAYSSDCGNGSRFNVRVLAPVLTLNSFIVYILRRVKLFEPQFP